MTGNPIQKISVIGAGSWGTALASMARRAGRDVMLYARDSGLAHAINHTHTNPVYLQGIALDAGIRATASMEEALAGAELILFVTPAQYMRETLKRMKDYVPVGAPLVNCSKGIEIASGSLLAGVAADVLPDTPYAVLSGPTFASEAVRGLPSAATLATTAPAADAMRWAEGLKSKTFRPYVSDDPTGAEVAGAIKNVIAIACGIVEGRNLGQNARAAIMTRGMAEMKRFGMKRGAKAETFLGLAGVGDVMLTCNSMTSRNFSLGHALGEGQKLDDIIKSRRTVAEGVATARAIAQAAASDAVDMPICLAVDQILHHNARVEDVVMTLLSRDIKTETE